MDLIHGYRIWVLAVCVEGWGWLHRVRKWASSCIGFYWVLLGLSNYGVRRKRGIRHFMGFVAYGICHPMGFVAYGDSHLMMFVANRVFSF